MDTHVRGLCAMEIAIDKEGPVARVALHGSLNAATASELEAALMPALVDVAEVQFDFAGLEYLSSAGLRVLMMVYKRLGGTGVRIEHACDEIREVFDITGFSALFDIS